MARDNYWLLKNRRDVGKNETPFWIFSSYEYIELKNKPKNSVRTWSSRKAEILCKITSFLLLNLNAQIMYFQS